jgi:hypothetical protein
VEDKLMPTEATVTDAGALIFAPFGEGVALGVEGEVLVAVGVAVGVTFEVEVGVAVPFDVEVAVAVAFEVLVGVAVGVGVRVGVAVTEAAPSMKAPRPWVPMKITPVEFCSMS